MESNSRFRKVADSASKDDPFERVCQFLIATHEAGGSGLIVNSNNPLWSRVHGKWEVSDPLVISNEKAFRVLTGVFGFESASGTIKSGRDLDFSFEISISRREIVRFRVNATAIETSGQQIGVSITFRPLPSMPIGVEELGVDQKIIDAFLGDNARSGGLVLVSGETGSGKSTLLASLIRNNIEAGLETGNGPHVLSFEAPIEFNLANIKGAAPVEQSEIPRHLPDFASAARNALRREADMLFFGESRDQETFQYMLVNAEQGSKVVTTLHARQLSSVIGRVLAMFPENDREVRRQSLVSSLSLMIHQRLVFDTRGQRVAINEYCVIDDDLRESMMRTNDVELVLQGVLEDLNDDRGRSMSVHALQRFNEGRISQEMLDSIRKGAKL